MARLSEVEFPMATVLEEAAREAALEHAWLVPTGFGGRPWKWQGREAKEVSLRSLTATLAYQPEDLVVTVQAGRSLQDLNKELVQRGQWIPYDPVDGQDDSVGGLVSAGLDSDLTGGYGPMRDRVLGLTAWTPGFGVIRAGGSVVKNVAGFNLPRLFAGSRGQFGVILTVTFKVAPLASCRTVWQWQGSGAELAERANRLMELTPGWTALTLDVENGQGRLWARYDGSTATAARLADKLGAGGEPTARQSWPDKTVVTGTVPRSEMAELVEKWPGRLVLEWQSGWFWGQLAEDRQINPWQAKVTGLGGSWRPVRGTAPEQGDRLVVPDVYRRLKSAFDPLGVLPTV